MLSVITIQSSLRIHYLPLHLLRHYLIFQVCNILSNLHTLLYYTLSPPHSALIHHRLSMPVSPRPHPPAHPHRPHTRRHHVFPARTSRFWSQPVVASRQWGWHCARDFRQLDLRYPRCPLECCNAVRHPSNCCLSGCLGQCFWSLATQAPLQRSNCQEV